MPQEKNWYSEKEIQAMFGITVATLRKWRFLKKELPYFKVGGSVRYSHADIQEYLAKNKVDVQQAN